MYKLIFVDDEDIVREGIKSRISWEENGFHLVGVFENGLQALAYLQEHDVDVVLSDISMPRMDGLALSKEVASQFPRIQMLLLTGYEEFEYAQEAVKHRVKEFLLKPITAAELSAVLDRVKIELDRLRGAEDEQARLKEILQRSFPLLKDRFLYRLVSGRLSVDDIERRSSFFQWENRGGQYKVVLASMPETWEEITRLALAETARNECIEHDEVFSNRNEDLVLLLQGTDSEQLQARSRALAESLFRKGLDLDDNPISVGIGETAANLEEISHSYHGARNASYHSRVLGMDRVVAIGEIRGRDRLSQETFAAACRSLTEALRDGGAGKARQALDDVFALFEKSFLTMEDVSTYLPWLQHRLTDFMLEMDLYEGTDGEEQSLRFSRLDEARSFFVDLIGGIEYRIAARRHDLAISRLDRARAIISERYADLRFSLADICAELYLSTSQFSVLFKEGTGQTFVEYLTSVRINAAKSLLKNTDGRTYEIAEQVGYQDPRYFSSLFKKVTGLTTTEYRKGLEE